MKRGEERNAAIVSERSTGWAQEEREFYGDLQESTSQSHTLDKINERT